MITRNCGYVLLVMVAVGTACYSPETRDALADSPPVLVDLNQRLEGSGITTTLDPMDGAIPAEVLDLIHDDLTEDDAVKIALINNHSIRATLKTLGVTRADVLQAGLLSNPVFSANAKFFEAGPEIELSIAESFVQLFYRPLRMRVAQALLEEREAQVKGAIVHTAFDVRRAFVRVRAAQDVEDLARRVLVAAEGSYQLVLALHEAGNVTDPQLTIEQAALGEARLDLASALSRTAQLREPLNVLLGLWGDTTTKWTIDGHLDPVISAEYPAHLERRSIEQSLDLAAIRARAQRAAQSAGLAAWEGLFGDADLGAFAKKESGAGWGVGPGLNIPIPFFDRGQARVAAAEAELSAALHAYTATAVEIRSAARMLRERLTASAERAGFLIETQIPVRTRLVQETLQNYNAMQVGAFDVLLAKRQEIEAGREYIEALRDAHLARLDVAELVAGNLNHD